MFQLQSLIGNLRPDLFTQSTTLYDLSVSWNVFSKAEMRQFGIGSRGVKGGGAIWRVIDCIGFITQKSRLNCDDWQIRKQISLVSSLELAIFLSSRWTFAVLVRAWCPLVAGWLFPGWLRIGSENFEWFENLTSSSLNFPTRLASENHFEPWLGYRLSCAGRAGGNFG